MKHDIDKPMNSLFRSIIKLTAIKKELSSLTPKERLLIRVEFLKAMKEYKPKQEEKTEKKKSKLQKLMEEGA